MVAREAARRAGSIILSHRGTARVSLKEDHSLVTEADFKAQQSIIALIRAHFPQDGIVAEEDDVSWEAGGDHLWLIDPLDGTNNFAHGIPHYSISVACAHAGETVAGAVYDPLRDELFSAFKNGGAFLNDNPVTVSKTPFLPDAMVATGFYYDRGKMMRKTLESIGKLFEANIQGIRRFGSAALDLSWVACGRFDAYFEYKLSPWDFAAGMLLVREAGGRCTDAAGAPASLRSTGIAASNGLLQPEFVNIIKWDGGVAEEQ
jgi:myo-inositol-1(or 4)-monophosphatase